MSNNNTEIQVVEINQQFATDIAAGLSSFPKRLPAKYFYDEKGDAIAKAGIPFDVGMEASALTGEDVHVLSSNDIIQDITYAAVLKDYGKGVDCTMVRPIGYDPLEFDAACTDYYNDKSRIAPNVDAQKMIVYGKLPNKKYMINWPGHGNDIYLNLIVLSELSLSLKTEFMISVFS